MSSTKTEFDVRPPRETSAFYGHDEAEMTLLRAYQSQRLPHAWLIGGAPGIGKATLAYRMARFVLAHPDPSVTAVQSAETLHVSDENPVARQIANGSCGGLLTLERTVNERGVLRTVITVNESRATLSFFGSTAASNNGWRVCIVDTVDELNGNAANALLKVLEEPPSQSLFLLVTNAPGRVLPTIQSRCRRLSLRTLSTPDVVSAVVSATGIPGTDVNVIAAASQSEGSVSQALAKLDDEVRALGRQVQALLDRLPVLDSAALHALGDALSVGDRTRVAGFIDQIEGWLSRQLDQRNGNLARLAPVAEVWEKIGRLARDADIFNLERKPLVFSVFGLLAEVAAS
jgi:DNA polymerase-3 subunit delta'